MNKHKFDLLLALLLLGSAFFLVLDIFLHKGQFANFDGNTHSVTIAQFFRAFLDGDLKVTWADGFTKYGFAIPIFSQQITSYFGAIINFATHDITVSIHLIYFISALISVVGIYWLLRLHFSSTSSFVAALLFNLSAYRIINLYVRSALPEFAAMVWVPFICISIHFLLKGRKIYFFLLIGSLVGLILSHPMMLVVYSFFIAAYILPQILYSKNTLLKMGVLAIAGIWALLISGYYVIPLLREIKYYNYGNQKNHYEPNHHLTLPQFCSPDWPYFYREDIYTRGNFLKIGEIEFGLIVLAGAVSLFSLRKKKEKTYQDYLFISGTVLCGVVLYLLSPFSVWVFKTVDLLSNIQYPWRLLSVTTLFAPLFLAYLLDLDSLKKHKMTISVLVVLIIFLLRVPQLYGKNYTYYDQSTYFSIPNNIHVASMNTPWTGRIEDYPIKKNRLEIIEGKAKILKSVRKNSWRLYELDAESPLRLVEYSFYFPGWKAYVDGRETIIEFQDINYRGIVTFRVPQGRHTVKIVFEDTLVRKFATAVSIVSTLLFVLFFWYSKSIIQ